MTEPSKKTPHRLAVEAFHAQVSERFPSVFGPRSEPYLRPKLLKVGVHKDLFVEFPDVPKPTIRRFLGWYTHSREYLKLSLTAGAERYDLNAQPAGVVTDAEVIFANEILEGSPQKVGSKQGT